MCRFLGGLRPPVRQWPVVGVAYSRHHTQPIPFLLQSSGNAAFDQVVAEVFEGIISEDRAAVPTVDDMVTLAYFGSLRGMAFPNVITPGPVYEFVVPVNSVTRRPGSSSR